MKIGNGTLSGTFEAETFGALFSMHKHEGGHDILRGDTGMQDVCEQCETCLRLKRLRVLLMAEEKIEDADLEGLADLLLIEQELATMMAESYVTSNTTREQVDADYWYDTDVDSREAYEAYEAIRKAVLYLDYRKLIEHHPERPELVRLLETN